jgi:hypothetical protein
MTIFGKIIKKKCGEGEKGEGILHRYIRIEESIHFCPLRWHIE